MIEDFNSIQMKHRQMVLARAIGLTDDEIERIIKCKWDMYEIDDEPFTVDLPDGSTANNRDELEHWYAEHGERI